MDRILQLAQWALTEPEKPALLAPGKAPLTYATLLSLVRQGRDEFRHAGLPAGPVCVLMQTGLASMVTCLALSSGSTCVPLDPSLTFDEYFRYLKRLRAGAVVLTGSGESPALAAARELGLLALRARLAGGGGEDGLAVETMSPRTSTEPSRHTEAPLVFLSSSTTGDPKLVPLSEDGIQAHIACDGRAFQLGPEDRLLTGMPLFHVFGFGRVLSQLHYGGSAVCTPGFDVSQLPSWWEEFHPTWMATGASALHAVVTAGPAARRVFAGAAPRFILVGGATPEPALCQAAQEVMRAPVLVGYGSTECAGATRNTIAASKPGSAGISFGPTIAVADASGNALPANRQGEILLRGAGVVSGYLDDEEATRSAFRDGWFHSGDLGYLDDEGFLFITGRIKEIISRGNEKIQPSEIDRVLLSHPSVQDAAAFGVPHRTLGENVAAAIVLREGAHLTAADLRHYAASRLAAFKVPRPIVFVDSIPRTAAGKPQRTLLADRYIADAARERRIERPRTATEQRIMRIWAEILGMKTISLDGDFIELGGDSLSCARMLAEVDREFDTDGQVMARADFLDEPTIETLARIVAECQATRDTRENDGDGILVFHAAHAVGSSESMNAVPLFCFPGWRGRDGGPVDPYYLRPLAASLGAQLSLCVVTASIPTNYETARRVEDLARSSIEAIRKVQAHGPYLLAGHCFGAVVAFEAARQLRAEGETVLRLLFFDAVTPGYPKLAANWSKYLTQVIGIVRTLDWKRARSQTYTLGILLQRRIVGRWRRRTERTSLGRGLNENPLNTRAAVALWQYELRDCCVPIVHFLAADHPVSEVLDDPRYGWQDVARAGIEVREVAGDHDSLLSLDNAPGLADSIHACLTGQVLASSATPQKPDVNQAGAGKL